MRAQKSPAARGGNGAHSKDHHQDRPAAGRRQAAPTPFPARLSAADRANLEEALGLARRLAHKALRRGGRREVLGLSLDLLESLACWHRRVARAAYARDMGSRP